MSILTFDVETTTKLKGHPFCPDNRLVTAGFLLDGVYFETVDKDLIKETFEKAKVIVGFNAKFDLHWLRREFGVVVTDKQLWDCQIAHFLITCQLERYPSLNSACAFNGLESKLDIAK